MVSASKEESLAAQVKWHVRRNEAFFELAEALDKFNESITLEVGKRDASGRFVYACHVLVWSKEPDRPARVFVSLHALEALKGVVEDAGRGIEREVLVFRDARWKPSFRCCPFDGKHVVCAPHQ